jgi:2-oxoglutarate ferredoxin oxidoreductase subunit alpha
MLNGNEAIVLGALAAGCNFCPFYPMTPATSVVLGLIEKGQGLGVIVEQAEDEISAVNMAIGASFAGARAIVPTSGGGFALMTEGVSLAGMIEQPVVFVLGMRPGPATGLPTRTEQSDLPMALHAGHGEFPRAIYAPGTAEECFRLTHEAFFIAERFQGPVIVMTDQFLADSYRSVEPFDLDSLPEIPPPLTSTDDPASYRRYAAAEDGVSPRLVPGFGPYLVVADSDEHDEAGHIIEDGAGRVAMVEKRLRKGHGIAARAVPPSFLGDLGPDLLLVCWGSTRGPAEEAAARLRDMGNGGPAGQPGRKVAVLHFSQVWPLRPDQFMQVLENAGEVVSVEGNATGQFAALLRQETGFGIGRQVLRYDGRPFTPEYILAALGEN